MDLTAIARIARARWLILVGAALVAVIITGRLADYQAANVLTHEAAATVTFKEDPASFDRASFEDVLIDQHNLALDVNSDVVGSTPGAFLPWQVAEVDLTLDQNQITFIGRGYSQEEANALVETMQSRYLAISTVGAGYEQLTQELDDLAVEIAALEAKIAQRQLPPALNEEQVIIETNRAALQSALGSLTGQYGELRAELVTPVERTPAQIQADIDRVQSEMVRLQSELAAMPAPPTVGVVDEQLIIDQLKLDNLNTRHQTVYAEMARLEGLATGNPVIPQTVTAVTGSPFTNQALALAAAVIVTLMALVAIERTRGIIWAAKEVDGTVPALTELPPRGFATFKRPTDLPWYLSVPGGHRKAAVQLIRSQLDNYHNVVVAFQGVGVYDEDTLDLTADVAMSAAVSGRRVLLIDSTFSGRNRLIEYASANTTLTSLLAESSDDPESAMAEIKEVLLSQSEVHRNLRVLRSGEDPVDAGDALAGHLFEMLLDVAREVFDLVIVAGAAFGEPTSYIIAQRVDQAILVGSIGHTIDEDIEAAVRDFRVRRAVLMGLVLIRRRPSRTARWLAPRTRRTVWRATDNIKPMSEKIKESFVADDMENQPGMSGFTERLNEVESADRHRYLNDSEDEGL
jgi:hypothetical protein